MRSMMSIGVKHSGAAELVGLFSLLFGDGDVEQCSATSDAVHLRLAEDAEAADAYESHG
jgi:hypothetical protein